MKPTMEYLVNQFGDHFRAAKPEDVQMFLDLAAGDGWELSQVTSNGNKFMLIMSRKIEERSKKRAHTWP